MAPGRSRPIPACGRKTYSLCHILSLHVSIARKPLNR
jgi:hypothetical protein